VPAGALLQPFLRKEKKGEYISIEMYVFIAGIMIYLNLVERMWSEATTTLLRQMWCSLDPFVHCW